jgi:hypothetical protein
MTIRLVEKWNRVQLFTQLVMKPNSASVSDCSTCILSNLRGIDTSVSTCVTCTCRSGDMTAPLSRMHVEKAASRAPAEEPDNVIG